MHCLLIIALALLAVQQCVAPPVIKNKEEEKKKHDVEEDDDMKNTMEYHRYLNEIVEALESDPEFRKKLETAPETDIRSGKIADQLDFVSHKVRTQLDEIKRAELERLRHLATQQFEMENDLNPNHLKIAEHVDHTNPHTFEVSDLKKLIAKTTEDLAEADRKRRLEFKEYEMQKKYEQEEKMKKLNEEEKKKYADEIKALEEKHKKHKPLHHPGSKQQLEEVWEEQDHMNSQEFDPRTFFYLHDIDGNGVWDQDEVKTLFLKELDKLYADGMPEDDLRERQEEMERMREHVFSEADVNKDGLISYKEFVEQTKKPEFEKDQGWESLDEQQIYSQQEYEAFEKARQREIEMMIAKGILPPQQGNVDPGNPQQFPPQYGNVPVDHQQQPGQLPLPSTMPDHLQQPPQQHPQGVLPQHGQPQQQHFQGQQVPQHQGQPPQHYQQQQFQGHQQVPQYQGQQAPQYQGHQVPQFQGQQQVPQYQGQQQQVPQYQAHPAQGQVPVQHQQQAPVRAEQVPMQQQSAQLDQAHAQQNHQSSGHQRQVNQGQSNAHGQPQQQQPNIPTQNNQAHQQAGNNQPDANSVHAAPSPNVVKT